MIETAAGILLIAIALADLFATVLLVRGDASILSPFVTRAVWWLFKRADRRLGLDGRLMMLAGPILLVLIVLLWALLLVTGFALLYLPMLGQAVNASTGTLRPTFGAAMYFSGYDFSTLGLGDAVPRSGAARMLTVIEACTGFGAVTLAISYTLNIYNAVNRQESFALQLHGGSDATGWAAVALTGLYPAGKPDQNASSLLEAIAGQAYQLLQIHRSYPLARYYRRRQPELSTVRITFHLLDLVTLIEAVFSAGQSIPARHTWFRQLAPCRLCLRRSRPRHRSTGRPRELAGVFRPQHRIDRGQYRYPGGRGGMAALCRHTVPLGRSRPPSRRAPGLFLRDDRQPLDPAGPAPAWGSIAERPSECRLRGTAHV